MTHRAIDLVHLARQTGGDDALEQELLALFADQCERQLAAIQQAVDRPGCADAAHTLKGAARAVGAWSVAQAAESIEHALSASAPPGGLPADLPVHVAALRKAASEARVAISALAVAA